jgi:hypothetical protein
MSLMIGGHYFQLTETDMPSARSVRRPSVLARITLSL